MNFKKKLRMLISKLKEVCLFVPTRMMEQRFLKLQSISLLISIPKNTQNLQCIGETGASCNMG